MRDAYEMMEYLEYLLHDTSANMWSEVKKLETLNAAYDQVANRVIELHENWFYSTATLTAGTVEFEATPFDFPAAPSTIAKILMITDTDGVPLEPTPLQLRDYSYPALADRNIQMNYWIAHDKIWVNADSYSGNLRLYYVRRPPRMFRGICDTTSATTITLKAANRPSVVNDYYNNLTVNNRAGTGSGETTTITDYVGSTGVATAAFTTTPDTTSDIATVSEIPNGHNELVVMGAAIRALMFDVAQQPKLDQFKQWYTKLEFDLMDFLQNRQTQQSRGVFMKNLD